jgi:hypothetical protein
MEHTAHRCQFAFPAVLVSLGLQVSLVSFGSLLLNMVLFNWSKNAVAYAWRCSARAAVSAFLEGRFLVEGDALDVAMTAERVGRVRAKVGVATGSSSELRLMTLSALDTAARGFWGRNGVLGPGVVALVGGRMGFRALLGSSLASSNVTDNFNTERRVTYRMRIEPSLTFQGSSSATGGAGVCAATTDEAGSVYSCVVSSTTLGLTAGLVEAF